MSITELFNETIIQELDRTELYPSQLDTKVSDDSSIKRSYIQKNRMAFL